MSINFSEKIAGPIALYQFWYSIFFSLIPHTKVAKLVLSGGARPFPALWHFAERLFYFL